jgi:heat shock protein HslJ
LAELEAATFFGLEGSDGPITLHGGGWEGEPYVAGGAARPTALLLPDFRLTGDLDGEGADEAVVLVNLATGGTGQLLHLAVVGRRAGGVENIATAFIGDRVQVRGGRIETAVPLISLDLVRAGPQDAACCPGELVTLAWILAPSGALQAAGASETARLSLAVLGGVEWILTAWNRGEPAPEDPAIALVYEDGNLAGYSGCNRFFATAKDGETPGDLSVGPVGATKMMCPDPQMSVEQRFLSQLAGARKYGFLAGNLVLTCELNDVWRTMVFRRASSGDGG